MITFPILNTININCIRNKRLIESSYLSIILRGLKRYADRARFKVLRFLDPGDIYYTDEVEEIDKYDIRKTIQWICVSFIFDFFHYSWFYHLTRLCAPVVFPLFIRLRSKYRKLLFSVKKSFRRTVQRIHLMKLRISDFLPWLRYPIVSSKPKLCLEDLPIEILHRIADYNLDKTTLLTLNSLFLKVFASKFYSNIHGFIAITATTELKFMDRWTSSGNLDGFDPAFDDTTYFDAATYWTKTRFKVFERIQKRQNHEPFRILQLGTRGNLYQLSEERLKYLKSATLVQNPEKLFQICADIVNNPKSILRRYIKNFTADVLVLEDYPTPNRSISYMLEVLQKNFSKPEHEIKAESKTIQVFTDYYVASVDAPFPGIDMPFSMRDVMDGVPFRKMMVVSKFFEMFLTGERFNLAKCTHKLDLEQIINKSLEDFEIDKNGEVPAILEPSTENYNDMNEMSWQLAIKCIEEAEKVKVEDSVFASWFDVAILLRELIRAANMNPVDGGTPSLTISRMRLDSMIYPDGSQFTKQKLKILAYNAEALRARDELMKKYRRYRV